MADIGFKVGVGHRTPPKGYPEKSVEYADPVNHKYPLDTPGRIRAAMHYASDPRNKVAGHYSDAEWVAIRARIARAANRVFGPGHAGSGTGSFVRSSPAVQALRRKAS